LPDEIKIGKEITVKVPLWLARDRNGAIYSMTPCSEEIAPAALNHIMPEPVSVWMPELQKLPTPGEFCDACGLSDCDGDCG
jgi:hypothetical protein